MNWTRKDLIGLSELSADELNLVLQTAAAFKDVGTREIKKVPALRGKTLVNFFVEPSTRTRVSFELAALRLSADIINVSASTSSLTKGETLKDTALNLEALHADIIVLRHSSAGAAQFLAERLASSVINGGDGAHEHPTQGLLDLLTLRDAWNGRFEGRRLAIVGDIAHSRVARSAIHGLRALGAAVVVTGPPTLVPREIETLGCWRAPSVEQAMEGADGVMALRIQHERMESGLAPTPGEYARTWGIDEARVRRMKPEAVVMHPGPMNRGVEIASEVADGPRSVIFRQTENGVAVRCAVLARAADALAERAA